MNRANFDLNILQQEFSADESNFIHSLEFQIGQSKTQLQFFSESRLQAGFEKLAPQRILASGTLSRGDHASWMQVNEQVQTWVVQDLQPTWVDICEINSVLTSRSPSEVQRKQEIYVGPYQACPVDSLDKALSLFKNKILPNQQRHSSLVYACLCQYWLVSLHPFWDGNGRTAILLTDWIAALSDYLPQSFTSKANAIVMYQPGRPIVMTPGQSVIRILQNILNSYSYF